MIGTAGDEIMRKVKAIYLWNITKDGKTVSKWSKQRAVHKFIHDLMCSCGPQESTWVSVSW